MQGYFVPVFQIVLFSLNDLQLALRIINESGQTFFILTADGVAEFLVDLTAHGTGAVFQDMVELFIFPVNVRQKMFRSLRQVQNGLQIDDLCSGCRLCFVLVRERL